MKTEALLEALRNAADEDEGPRRGYSALEALTRGDITPEELRLLREKAASSPDWAEAVSAHTPPDLADQKKLGEHLLGIIEAEQQHARDNHTSPPNRSRPVSLGRAIPVFLALAAGIVLFVAIGVPRQPALPELAAIADGSAMCSAGNYRGHEGLDPREACLRWIIRPRTADEGEMDIRVFAGDDLSAPLAAARVERGDKGVAHVYLDRGALERARVSQGKPALPKSLFFVVARPGHMPDAKALAAEPGAGARWMKLAVDLDGPL